uniref:hypothetical protein n=1 Tax=Micromonospora haikouensis TaxID=686309 RepID=UPI003D706F09
PPNDRPLAAHWPAGGLRPASAARGQPWLVLRLGSDDRGLYAQSNAYEYQEASEDVRFGLP